jgi:hypothetical protein
MRTPQQVADAINAIGGMNCEVMAICLRMIGPAFDCGLVDELKALKNAASELNKAAVAKLGYEKERAA